MKSVKIISSKSEISIWTLLIMKDNDLIGYVKFNDYESMIKFKIAYTSLPNDQWGLVSLEICTEMKEQPC